MGDKKNKILKVAIGEFADHGYKAASTNRISEVAGVSKGLIFHYFGSKEKLYTTAVEYSVDLAMQEVPVAEMPTEDFIQGAIWSTKQKLNFSRKYPAVFKLIMQSYANPPASLAKRLHAYYTEMLQVQETYVNRVLEKVQLREGVAYEDAHDVVRALFDYTIMMATDFIRDNPEATMDEMQPLVNKFMNMVAVVEYGMMRET
ncbi:TetR/AcrR family transcriptional regulator [Listeria rocourtiae]|uniref:TetR/AcrR family transcriptional regulator n=1 Tax=Listeria rocourtiae TaxID=647910 RepID=UPI001629B52B|nr:TetR/AcrR family transcriptional regulator [Listeria rocourtiae]MBC1434669.1 TetR/AcrR family transcriptional regulator [Listeria rocourtiae]